MLLDIATADSIRAGDMPPLVLADYLEEQDQWQVAELLRTGRWVYVPAGTFWMGGGSQSPPTQQVTIDHDFLLGKYPVTQAEWQGVMGNNPSYFKGDDLPVERVSWDDCQAFLAKFNAGNPEEYRLPTDVEWEYACRNATQSKEECSFDFYFGQPTNNLSSAQANFDGNYPAGNATKSKYLRRTTKVGAYPPNRLGLYDMHGNMWEWCQDFFEQTPLEVLPGAAAERSAAAVGTTSARCAGRRSATPAHRRSGSTTSGSALPEESNKDSALVIRGGGWYSRGSECRTAFRYASAPSLRISSLGFRLARIVDV